VLAVLLVAVTGCGGVDAGGTTDPPAGRDTTLTVLAAASLTETFTELARAFEAEHAAVDVRLAFDSSATLATQVAHGAPADVLATADARTMRQVVAAGATEAPPREFATNTMVLVVPAANPAGITSFADLDDSDVSYVACVESAPCGALAGSLLRANHVDNTPRSLEIDVRAVLSKVVLDEADAGLVYATDAVTAGNKVQTLTVPASSEAVNHYLAAALERSEQPELAADWVELLLSPAGRDILRDAGFGAP
jgi:molybdate transport system substrate-binding protein